MFLYRLREQHDDCVYFVSAGQVYGRILGTPYLFPSRVAFSSGFLASQDAAEVLLQTNQEVVVAERTARTLMPLKDLQLLLAHRAGEQPELVPATGPPEPIHRCVPSGERARCSTGILQATLLTRHMLFVGFSLRDDNFFVSWMRFGESCEHHRRSLQRFRPPAPP